MATHIQGDFDQNRIGSLDIGTSSSTRYTITRGQMVYTGTDGDSNTERVIPTTDVSAHIPIGLSLDITASAAKNNEKCAFATFAGGLRIWTDNVDGTNPPAPGADNKVYALDAGTFSNTDTDSSQHELGTCVRTKSINGTTHYLLALDMPDLDTDT